MTVVDARGLRCPLPVVRLAAACRDLPPGSEVALVWTDPAARVDVPAWARMRGHTVVGSVPLTDAGIGDVAGPEAGEEASATADGLGPAFVTTVRLAG